MAPGGQSPRPSTVVKMEAIVVEVFDRELPESPRLGFERLDDVRAGGLELGITLVDFRRMHPEHRGFEGRGALAEENRRVIPVHRADLLAGLDPADLETERVAVVSLRALDVGNREFGDGRVEGRGLRVHV